MVELEHARTEAELTASRHWERNLRALRARQPRLAPEVEAATLDVEWVFGRDGALAARVDGGWWGGCSLPRRTARKLLERMELGAAVTCFLSPTYAAELRETLDRMSFGKALVAVVPDLRDLRVMLASGDFGADLEAGRLWFAAGADWAGELERLFREQEGLPTPGQFVRTGLADEGVVREMIQAAQDLIGRETARRAEVVRSIYAGSRRTDDVCAVAPRAFRLWEDVGGVIGDIADREGWRVLNPDDPREASPVALARAAAGCGAMLMSNVGRSDLPAEFPSATRVVTWVTGPRAPRFEPRGAGDVLLLADERWRGLATAAGWPGGRMMLGGWPVERRSGAGAELGVIADTVAIEAPEFELSSHKILWETIARELSDDPFAVGDDAGAYLANWLKRAGISGESFNARLFVERLIVPAYQQGLVGWLLGAGLDVKLFGRGWDGLAGPAERHAGEVRDRASLAVAVDACAALVHVWPVAGAHAIDATGRPVLRRGGKGREQWLNEARNLALGNVRIGPQKGVVLSADLVRRAISLPSPA
jgi:hypothetical protein